ncbi:hypothetical protein MTY414_59760 [Mycolicibacterium mageritense]|nr:hypothetical protein MTY414_59760 [Mycolicibacterium mageritense]
MNLNQLPIDPPMRPSEDAPNWGKGMGLTWSGKWHIISSSQRGHYESLRTLCGTAVYTRDNVPRHHATLQAIASGRRQAPVCKKCERAQAKGGDA